jgi:hypothetical protein
MWSIQVQAQIRLKEMERPELITSIDLNKRAMDYQLENLYLNQDSLAIRVWMNGSVLNIIKNKDVHVQFITSIYSNSKNQRVWKKYEIEPKTAQDLYNYLIKEDICNIPNKRGIGIDGTTYVFEIATASKYRTYSYWSPNTTSEDSLERKVALLLQEIRQKVKSAELYNDFYENLEAGNYMYGMMIFLRIERFLPENAPKSELYKEVEKIMRNELGVSEKTSVRTYPRIIIDDREFFLKDLNWIDRKDIESIQVLKDVKPEMAIIYGDLSYGLIKIQTYQYLNQIELDKKALEEWNKKHSQNNKTKKKDKK